MLTWSLGWTPTPSPAISRARRAMTSLALVLVEVPEPVWNRSTTNWSSSRPSITSVALATMASAKARSS